MNFISASWSRYLGVLSLMAIAIVLCLTMTASRPTQAVSSSIVVSQIYGGGGNAGAQYTNDFIELYNRGSVAVDVTGWSVQYNSAAGTGAFQVTPICPTGPCLIQPGKYFLVQEAAGAGTPGPLPSPDVTTGAIAMSATVGRVAVVNSITAIPANATCAAQLSGSVDFVGYGTTASCFEGVGPAPAPSNTTADLRQGGGCHETDNNSADFYVAAPAPRNSATAASACSASTPARNKRADVDGDLKADVSVWRPTNRNWYILQSSLSNTLKVVVDWGSSSLNDIAVPGDYDADGKTDVAVYRPSEGNWYIINSSTGNPSLVNWGASTDIPAPGDYDGDRQTDVAVYRPSEGNWYVRGSLSGTTVRSWGVANTDIPIYGHDFDGDAKADLAVYRPSESKWYIRNSNGVTTLTAVSWGQSGDRLVPADYDGDGKEDIAVFRPSEGNWYIRKSTGGVTLQNWGASTDLLVPADYDNDGKADIAVFRPSEGNWYILNSSGSPAVSVINLGTSGDVPVPNAYLGPNGSNLIP